MQFIPLFVALMGCDSASKTGAAGEKGDVGERGEAGSPGTPGDDGAEGAVGATGSPGVSSRTQLHIFTDTAGDLCHVAAGDGTVALRTECCPTGFSLVGSEDGSVICLENEPARARVALVLDVSADERFCDELADEGTCCADGFTFVGWDSHGVLCLQD